MPAPLPVVGDRERKDSCAGMLPHSGSDGSSREHLSFKIVLKTFCSLQKRNPFLVFSSLGTSVAAAGAAVHKS